MIGMEPEATLTLPAVSGTITRNLYFYEGDEISIEGEAIPGLRRVKLLGDQDIAITNGCSESHLLLLEGEPIREPIVQIGRAHV